MKLLSNNLKKAGYFNAALIVIAIVLRLISIVVVPTIIKIDAVLCIAALVYGFLYALNGYKKDVAKYYKSFMYLYLISSVLSLGTSLSLAIADLGNFGILMIVSNIIIVISIFVLAFVKDFGEKKSNTLSLLVLSLNVFKLLSDISIKGITTPIISAGFGNLILACVLCVFVAAKYADKKSRGAK